MPLGLVSGQTNDTDAGTVSSASLIFPSAVIAGDSILVVLRLGGTTSTVTVADDKNTGNYTVDFFQTDTTNGESLHVFRFSNSVAGAKTVSATVSGGAQTVRWWIGEVNFNAGLDSGVSNTTWQLLTSQATAMDSGTSANPTNEANCYILGAGMTGAQLTFTATSPFILRNTSASHRILVEDQTVSATGTQRAQATTSTNDTGRMTVVLAYYAVAAPSVPIMDWSAPGNLPRFQAELRCFERSDTGLPPSSFFVDLALLDAVRSAVPLPRFAKGFRGADPGTQSLLTVYPPVLPLQDDGTRRPRRAFAPIDPGAENLFLYSFATPPLQNDAALRLPHRLLFLDPGADSLVVSPPPSPPPLVLGWETRTGDALVLRRVFRSTDEGQGWFIWPVPPQLVPPPPPPPPPSVAGGVVAPAVYPLADAVDDDTERAIVLLWQLNLDVELDLAWAVDDDTERAIVLLWQHADLGDITPASAVDDDTEQAVILFWGQAVQFAELFKTGPRTGRQKSIQPGADIAATGPYVVIDSKLLRTELIAADSAASYAWNDYRTVTMTIYGLRADVVKGIELILAVFNRRLGAPGRPTLTYPSGARFMRWWPIGNAVIEEDKDSKAGKDVWKGTIRAEVWSVRDELVRPEPAGTTATAGDQFGAIEAPSGAGGISGQFGDAD